MEAFSIVIFGFTSNLAQLKIIPALYDLEEKGLLTTDTKIVGIGRKNLNVTSFVDEVLHSKSRHHHHTIDLSIQKKLVSKIDYLQENFEEQDGPLYSKLTEISGDVLYYLATYPNLYSKIFKSLSDTNLNNRNTGWTRIMIEKPIGNDLKTAVALDSLLSTYFTEDQIFRVDHYLGKESLRKTFGSGVKREGVERVEISISENFGIGKRGVYYDATGALIDMGQNHLLQMLVAIVAKSSNSSDRAKILEALVAEPKNIIFGQYADYLKEENVSPVSVTDTFFALKTEIKDGEWANVPFYLTSGKMLDKDLAQITIYYSTDSPKVFIISPLKVEEKFDPYERLILDAVHGDQTFFNSPREIEASWKFIDKLSVKNDNPFIYKAGSNLCDGVASKFST